MQTYEFDYKKPATVAEAIQLLADLGDGASLLAGGHSLIPAMKLRLAEPQTLIDLRATGLGDIGGTNAGARIGAMATHRSVEHSKVVKEYCPALGDAAAGIGDPQVRNCGTIGGSIAHADPSADYPAVLLALDATIEVEGPSGSRMIAVDDFFAGFFETALAEGEIITAIHVPMMNGAGAAYAKFPNPASRYAVVGVAARVRTDGTNCTEARVGVTGAAPYAFRWTSLESSLVGNPLSAENIEAATAEKLDASELLDDLAANADYRAHLASVMAKRALTTAAERVG